ncbi:MAG: hypothetical protein U1G07_24895 [Verrucomicrobiota bacterium]
MPSENDKDPSWLKILGFILGLAAFCWSVYTFSAAREIEAGKAYLESQLKTYADAVSTAGKIYAKVNSDAPTQRNKSNGGSEEWKRILGDFRALLAGPLRVVGSDTVYHAALDLYESASKNPIDDANNDPIKAVNGIQELVGKFADTCRSDLGKSWKRAPWLEQSISTTRSLPSRAAASR